MPLPKSDHMRRSCTVLLLVLALSASAASAFASSDPIASPTPSPSEAGSSPVPSVPSASPTPSSPAPSLHPAPSPTHSPKPKHPKPKHPKPKHPTPPKSVAVAKTSVEAVDKTTAAGATFNGKVRLQAIVDALRLQIDALNKKLAPLARQVSRAQLLYVQQTRATEMATRKKWAAKEELKKSSAGFYMTGAWQGTFAAMSAGDLEDVGRAQAYMQSVLGVDVDVVTRFRDAGKKYRKAFEKAILAAGSLRVSEASIRTQMNKLAALQAQTQQLLGVVVKAFGTGSSAFASLINAAQHSQSDLDASQRTVALPVNGRVSSPFGWRIHPVYHYRSFHTGVDLAIAAGTPITAARDGVVLESAYAGPYGLVTVIDNGFRVATVYAHQSGSLVHEGDHVSAGQVIGFVGCSGWCTGPHLHFEVWFHGHPHDPMGWIVPGPRLSSRRSRTTV